MLVKKTGTGRISLELSLEERRCIFNAALQGADLIAHPTTLTNERSVLLYLHANLLAELVARLDFKLHINKPIRWWLSKAEAISLMWMLRHHDTNLMLLDVKSGLHQTLIA